MNDEKEVSDPNVIPILEAVSSEDEQEYSCSKNNARKDKRLNRCLIELSEEFNENEEVLDRIYIGGSLEKFCSWENVVPNPKYIVPKKKKQTVQEEILSDEQERKVENDPFIHCYEIQFVDCPAWKMGVEPLTYRYMLNHGRYRAHKLSQRLTNANRLRGNGKVDYDRQKLRTAIQNELRKEFELFLKTEKHKISMLRQQELVEKKKKSKIKKPEVEYAPSNLEQSSHGIFEKDSLTTKEANKCGPLVKDDVLENFTPRSNISIISSQTPLPPINVPLVSKEDNNDKDANNEKSDRKFKYEDLKKPQKLWHIPAQISVNDDTDVMLRHRSAPKQLEKYSLSEPGTRVSSRSSGHSSNSANKSIQRDDQLFRLKKLPTISDFHENETTSASQNEKETFIVRRMSQPVNNAVQLSFKDKEINLYRPVDNVSVYSEPALAPTPVLQGTAYDINKLRKGAQEMYRVNPDTVSLIEEVRSSQNRPQDPTHLQYLATKYKSENIFDINTESLNDIISTKQYVSSKNRTGLNPYMGKPKANGGTQNGVPMNSLEKGIGDSFKTVPINTNTSDVMPEMMVRRAEISVTSKRVI